MTLDEIIEGCKNNNQRCYTKLYNIYKPKLTFVIKQYFKDIDTIEEVLQQTFIRICEKIGTYANTGSFEGWLVMIAKNKSIDHFRKQNVEIGLIDNVHLTFNPFSEEELNEDIEVNSNLIKECVNQLTPAYREVFDLYVIQEYQHKEIAEMLGITEGSSKSNLFKAKNKIKKILNSKFEFN
jgi:RNA polymerase sigma-70 factor (ECF subfamily)